MSSALPFALPRFLADNYSVSDNPDFNGFEAMDGSGFWEYPDPNPYMNPAWMYVTTHYLHIVVD